MLVGLRVVVVAVGENIGNRRADLVAGGVNEAKQEILRRVLNTEVVLGQPTLRGKDLNGARVRELAKSSVRAGNTHVPEADRAGKRIDCGLLPCQEVPAGGGLGLAESLDVARLVVRGHLWRFAGIDRGDDDVEVFPGRQMHHLKRTGETVKLLRAEHRAVVVHDGEDSGLAVRKVVAELDRMVEVIDEGCIERQLLIEVLRDADLLQDLGQLIRMIVASLLVPVAGHLRGGAYGRKQQSAEDTCPTCLPNCAAHAHRVLPFRALRGLKPLYLWYFLDAVQRYLAGANWACSEPSALP